MMGLNTVITIIDYRILSRAFCIVSFQLKEEGRSSRYICAISKSLVRGVVAFLGVPVVMVPTSIRELAELSPAGVTNRAIL